MSRLVLGAWLTLMWVALWGSVTVANVLGGALVALGLILVFPAGRRWTPAALFRPVAALRFAGHVLVQLVAANLQLARDILTPGDHFRRGIVAVPMASASDAVLSIVGNVITLTPGTLTVEVRREPPTLYVQTLYLRTEAELIAHVHDLERRALRAFPPGRGEQGPSGPEAR